jgi:hypothetical protein
MYPEFRLPVCGLPRPRVLSDGKPAAMLLTVRTMDLGLERIWLSRFYENPDDGAPPEI